MHQKFSWKSGERWKVLLLVQHVSRIKTGPYFSTINNVDFFKTDLQENFLPGIRLDIVVFICNEWNNEI